MIRHRLWTGDDLKAFLVATIDTRLEAAWQMLALARMRVGEVLALRWTDVDPVAGRINIRNAVVGAPYADLATPDSSTGARAIDAGPVFGVLDRQCWRQDAERSEWGAAYNDVGLVICREDGTPIHPRHLHRAFGRAVANAGLPPIQLTALRLSSMHAALGDRVRS